MTVYKAEAVGAPNKPKATSAVGKAVWVALTAILTLGMKHQAVPDLGDPNSGYVFMVAGVMYRESKGGIEPTRVISPAFEDKDGRTQVIKHLGDLEEMAGLAAGDVDTTNTNSVILSVYKLLTPAVVHADESLLVDNQGKAINAIILDGNTNKSQDVPVLIGADGVVVKGNSWTYTVHVATRTLAIERRVVKGQITPFSVQSMNAEIIVHGGVLSREQMQSWVCYR